MFSIIARDRPGAFRRGFEGMKLNYVRLVCFMHWCTKQVLHTASVKVMFWVNVLCFFGNADTFCIFFSNDLSYSRSRVLC